MNKKESQFFSDKKLIKFRDAKPFRIFTLDTNVIAPNYGAVYNCVTLTRIVAEKADKRVWDTLDLSENKLTASPTKKKVFVMVEHDSKSSLNSDEWCEITAAEVQVDSEVPENEDTKMYLQIAELDYSDQDGEQVVYVADRINEAEIWVAIRGEGSSEESSEESSSDDGNDASSEDSSDDGTGSSDDSSSG